MIRRTFLGMLVALFAPAVRANAAIKSKSERTIYPDGYIEHPGVLTRVPVMLDGVIRYLKPDDPRLYEGEPLRGYTSIRAWISTKRTEVGWDFRNGATRWGAYTCDDRRDWGPRLDDPFDTRKRRPQPFGIHR